MKKLILIIAALFAVTGCTGIEIDSGDLKSMVEKTAAVEQSCYDYMEARALEDAAAMEGLTKDQQFMYLLMKSQNEMVMALVGKEYNPCGGTNVYDYMARVAESQNQTAADLGGNALSAVKWIGSIYAGAELVEALAGTSVTVNGDGNSDIGNTYTTTQTQISGETTGNNTTDGTDSGTTATEEEETEWACDGCSIESLANGECTCD